MRKNNFVVFNIASLTTCVHKNMYAILVVPQ